jgi:basic membrane protein
MLFTIILRKIITIKEVCMRKVAVVLFTALAAFAFAQNDLQVIAEVNYSKREPITLGTVKTYVKNFEGQAQRTLTVEERRQILDVLVNSRLVLQLAQKEGIKVADSQVNEAFQYQLSQMVGQPITESQFEEKIKAEGYKSLDDFLKQQAGMTLAQYKERVRDELMHQIYIGQKYGAEIQKIDATQTEIEKYYDVNKQTFVRPDMVTAFLVAVEKKGQTATERAKIDALRARLLANPKATAQIEKEAKQENAGFITTTGYIYKTDQAAQSLGITMAQLLELFDLKVNTVTEVREMSNNFQFFVITGKENMKFLKLNDKIDPEQDTTVSQYLQAMIRAQKQQEAVQSAINDVVKSIRTDKTVKFSKTDDELKKLLAW